eukprot:6005059-Alexandrium_andersonii.AAC.1
MSASLVGSEMCIRDRLLGRQRGDGAVVDVGSHHLQLGLARGVRQVSDPVSYTHLTLPTICSV